MGKINLKVGRLIMKKIFIGAIMMLCLAFSACNTNSASSSIVGTWTEYRTDGDNYGISSWKFNSDGSGLFSVRGYSNIQRVAFTWKSKGGSLVEIYIDGGYQTLEINNGLLIENSYMGTIVYKKQ